MTHRDRANPSENTPADKKHTSKPATDPTTAPDNNLSGANTQHQRSAVQARRRLLWRLATACTAIGLLSVCMTFSMWRPVRVYRDTTLGENFARAFWRSADFARSARYRQPLVCVDAAVAWGSGCPGPDMLCQQLVNAIVSDCIAATDMRTACRNWGTQVADTRFGFQRCKPKYAHIASTAQKRRIKSLCAHSVRRVADSCGLFTTPQ